MTEANGMSPAALRAWGILAQAYPELNVTSAYRDPAHNAKVGGAKGSQHLHGNAYDINAAGWDQAKRQAFVQQAMKAGFNGFGNYDNSMHIDVGGRRVWGPSYGSDTAPAWLSSAVMGGQAPAGSMTPFNPDMQGLMAEYMASQEQNPWANAGGVLADAFAAPEAPQIAPMQATAIVGTGPDTRVLEFIKSMG